MPMITSTLGISRTQHPRHSQGTSQADPFGRSFGALADADGAAALRSAELTLPALVSGEAATRQAATEAKKELQLMLSGKRGGFNGGFNGKIFILGGSSHLVSGLYPQL